MRQELDARIARLVEAPLSADEFRRRLAVPLTAEEVEETQDLARWFTTRYPTVKERFDYVRRTYAAVASAPRLQ